MSSRYDNLDDVKWELVQIRIRSSLKEKFRDWCKLNDINGGMSGAIIMLIKGIMTTEEYDIQPAPEINKMAWAIKRVKPYMRRPNGNGNRKSFNFFR